MEFSLFLFYNENHMDWMGFPQILYFIENDLNSKKKIVLSRCYNVGLRNFQKFTTKLRSIQGERERDIPMEKFNMDRLD